MAVSSSAALDDQRLAALAAQGSRRAFSQLYERHSGPLYRYCMAILRQHDDAQDAVQSTMARALAALERRDPPTSTRAWLYSIAYHESIDQLRRRRPHGELCDAEHVAGAAPVDRRVEHRERLSATLRDLQQLPERQRSALVMREMGGLSDAEIGQNLGISPAGVRQAVFEARTALNDFAAGREISCADIRRAIAAGDGRRLRARTVRAHLRACAGCQELRESTRGRRRTLAGLVPLWVAELAARLTGSAPVSAGDPGALAAKTLVAAALGLTLGVGVARHQALEAGRAPGLTPAPPVSTTPMPGRVAAAPSRAAAAARQDATATPAAQTVTRARAAAPAVVPHAVSVHRSTRPAGPRPVAHRPVAPSQPAAWSAPSREPAPAAAAAPSDLQAAAAPAPAAQTATTAPASAAADAGPGASPSTPPGLAGALNPGHGAVPPGQGGVPPGQAKKQPAE